MNQFGSFACCVGMFAMLAGCRAPQSFDPFAPYGPTRIPPPSTGAIGSAARSYDGGVSTAQRSSASPFGTPGQTRPDLGTGTSAPPEDRGWSNPANPGAPAATPPTNPASSPTSTPGPAPVGPSGNPFGQASPQPGGASPTSVVSRAPLPDLLPSDGDLNWLDPRQRTAADSADFHDGSGSAVDNYDNLARVEILASDGYRDGYQLTGARAEAVPRLKSLAADPLNDFSSLAGTAGDAVAGDAVAGDRLASSGPRLRFSGTYGVADEDVRMSSTELPNQR